MQEKYILVLLKRFPHLFYLAEPELNLHKVFSGFLAVERCPEPGFRAVVLKLQSVSELFNTDCWALAKRASETIELPGPNSVHF